MLVEYKSLNEKLCSMTEFIQSKFACLEDDVNDIRKKSQSAPEVEHEAVREDPLVCLEQEERKREMKLWDEKLTLDQTSRQNQYKMLISFGAEFIEATCEALGFLAFKTKNLSSKVEEAIESGDFDECVRQYCNMNTNSVLKHPLSHFGTLFCRIALKNHLHEEKSTFASGPLNSRHDPSRFDSRTYERSYEPVYRHRRSYGQRRRQRSVSPPPPPRQAPNPRPPPPPRQAPNPGPPPPPRQAPNPGPPPPPRQAPNPGPPPPPRQASPPPPPRASNPHVGTRPKAYRTKNTFDFKKIQNVALKFQPMLQKLQNREESEKEIELSKKNIDTELSASNSLEF